MPRRPPAVSQLPLGLVHRPDYAREGFAVSDANREALALVERWPDWPGRVALIHGPAGAGKSHLAAIWAARAGAETLVPATVDPDAARDRAGAARALVLEDADRAAGDPKAERALLHLMNLMYERHGPVLLTARGPARGWRLELPDVASRANAAIAVAIAAPDDDLLAVVLAKHFADLRLELPPEVRHYALARMERSFPAAHQLAHAANAASLAERRPVTVPLLRQAMGWEG